MIPVFDLFFNQTQLFRVWLINFFQVVDINHIFANMLYDIIFALPQEVVCHLKDLQDHHIVGWEL